MRLPAIAMALLALGVAVGAAQANFAAAPGFSGRVADCAFCHVPPPTGEVAEVVVAGVPETWEPGATYDVTVSVSGGPIGNPAGPRAGFEIETLTGTFAPAPDAVGVRSFHDKQATYTEDGVFQREWQVRWTAPDLTATPMDVTWWVAGIAANGNHNVQTNTSALGEFGDSVDNATYSIAPSEATWAAWRALPLLPPTIEEVEATSHGHTIHGTLPDANATAIEVWDGSHWQERTVAAQWRLNVAGDGDVRIRATGNQRLSPEIVVDLGTGAVVGDVAAAGQDAPLPAWTLLLPLAFLAITRRHP